MWLIKPEYQLRNSELSQYYITLSHNAVSSTPDHKQE